MTLPKNRFKKILITIPLLLLIPLVAMQFTSEVNWTFFDFLVMGILLFILGSSIEITLRKVKVRNHRIALGVFIFGIFLLVWAELAVGIFGSPFAGS